MKRLTLTLAAILGLALLALAVVALFGPEMGLNTPSHDETLIVEALSEGSSASPLHLDPSDVREEAPSLYAMLETAYAEGEAKTRKEATLRESLDYLDAQGWNRSGDLEYRGRLFGVYVEGQ